jgi:glycosyltransferase involved in cell wall biosynthesis
MAAEPRGTRNFVVEISVVIPTRNRPKRVRNALASLAQQTSPPAEVIVVDASDEGLLDATALANAFQTLPLMVLSSAPSVCIQRNKGIEVAKSEWIFLCDDDIELPKDHLQQLANHVAKHPGCGAVAGKLRQLESGVWVDQYPPRKFSTALYQFVFQLSVWGPIDGVKTNRFTRPVLAWMRRWYRKRGNTESLAGWPLITQWHRPCFTTKFYSLGADLIRRELLLSSPYDPVLDPGGIGDNYGVALGLPSGIDVIDSTYALHHREQENRVDRKVAYYRRILAMHYFVRARLATATITTLWLCWSIIGLSLLQLRRFDVSMLKLSAKAFIKIAAGRNPYVIAKSAGKTVVSPN